MPAPTRQGVFGIALTTAGLPGKSWASSAIEIPVAIEITVLLVKSTF